MFLKEEGKEMKEIECPECDFVTDSWIKFREHVEKEHISAYYWYPQWLDDHGMY